MRSTQEQQRGSGTRTTSSNNQLNKQHKREKRRRRRRRRGDKSRKRRVREKEKGQGERERGERGKREEETGEKGKEVQEETDNEVEKHVTVWTEVSRKRKKMVQIFVKVDGGKTSVMEMEMNDKVDDVVKKIPISDQDVYVTSGGRILKGSDKLKSCEVRDGSTVEVTSRMRSGGKHKDKKSKAEKKQVMSQKAVSNEGPAILESEKEAIIRMWEENEGNRTFVQGISEGSDVEMEQTLQIYRAAGREALRWDQGSEGEMRGVGRTRPTGKVKERVTEERVNMKAKEEGLATKENSKRKGRERRSRSEWRQTWGLVAHTPRPCRIWERQKWRKVSNSAMKKRKKF